MRLALLCICIVSAGSGCSSVFYHPDAYPYVEASALEITPEDVELRSADGVKLHAWLFRSPRRPPRGLIVHFHGNAQNLTSHFAYLRSAPLEGFDHFIFDYRGYGLSEGKPSPEGLIEDGKAAMRWAERTKLPLTVFGQSLGGAVALKTLIELKSEVPVRQIVIDSSFLSYRSEARAVVGAHWLTWVLQPLAWLIVDNSQAPGARIKELSPTPLLIVHGQNDRTVAYWQGVEMYGKADVPKELWTVPSGGHTDFLFRKSWREKFYAWLGQTKKAPPKMGEADKLTN